MAHSVSARLEFIAEENSFGPRHDSDPGGGFGANSKWRSEAKVDAGQQNNEEAPYNVAESSSSVLCPKKPIWGDSGWEGGVGIK